MRRRRAHQPAPRAMTADRLGPTSRIFFSQRLRLHYVDWGNPDAPPLMLLHGGRDHCRNWDWVAAGAARRLPRHRARPARPRRFRLVGVGPLHDGELHLRPGAAHPPAGAGAGDRSLRTRSAATSRCATPASIPSGAPPGGDRGPRAPARAGTRTPSASRSPNGCAPGSTSSAPRPAGSRAATPRWRTRWRACRRRTSTSVPTRRGT